eukprot:364958-Chlamydomonas_euryale.AAC.9
MRRGGRHSRGDAKGEDGPRGEGENTAMQQQGALLLPQQLGGGGEGGGDGKVTKLAMLPWNNVCCCQPQQLAVSTAAQCVPQEAA